MPEAKIAFNVAKKSVPLLLAGLMLLVFALRIYHLPEYPYHEDDVASITIMSRIAEGHVPWDNQVFLRSPLGHMLMSLPLFVADSSQYSTRLVSVLFSVLLMPLLYQMGKEAQSPFAGLLAAVFLSISAYQNLFASFARFYPAFQFFFVSSVFFAGTYFILKKRQHSIWLFLSVLAAIFTHKLALQLFPVLLLALLVGRDWGVLKNKVFLGCTAIILSIVYLFFFAQGFSLAPRDMSPMTLGREIGGLWRHGDFFAFCRLFEGMVPLGWSLLLVGLALSRVAKHKVWHFYLLTFLVLMVATTFTAPGKNFRYLCHLLPLGVLGGSLTLCWLVRSASNVLARKAPLKESYALGVAVIALGGCLLLEASLGHSAFASSFGYHLKFIDQSAPHEQIKRYLKPGDLIISVDPGVTEFYLGRSDIYFLRQRFDQKTKKFVSFKGQENTPYLIDDQADLKELLNNTGHRIWIYGNWKFQDTVGPELRKLIEGNVDAVIYHDKKNKVFAASIKKR